MVNGVVAATQIVKDSDRGAAAHALYIALRSQHKANYLDASAILIFIGCLD